MIPISLKIQGLYSYQSEQHIDFNKLMEGQLFGIFGNVGSGKSSILEAISFALYGEIERMHLRDGRNYNMMNLKSNTLLIDFEFENFDQKRYRFVVRGNRNAKNFLDVKTFLRSAYVFESENWQPLPHANAAEVLGLSYENFRRTIIIPQGKFQEFMQLGDKERTTMLKEIFQLDRFEFSDQVNVLELQNSTSLAEMEGKLGMLQEVSQEEINQLAESLQHHTQLVEAAQLAYALAEQELQQALKLQNDATALLKVEAQLQELKNNESIIETLKVKVQGYKQALVHFKSDLNRYQEVEERHQRDVLDKESLTLQREQNDVDLERLTQEYNRLKADIEMLPAQELQLQEWTRVLEIQDKLGAQAGLKQRILKGTETLNANLSQLTELQTQFKALQEQLTTQKNTLPPLAELSELRLWFLELNNRQKQWQQHTLKLQQAQQQYQQSVQQMQAMAHPTLAYSNVLIAEEVQQAIQQERAKIKQSLEALQAEQQHLQLQQKLAEFSEQLEAGTPCPLCGALEHPQVLNIADVALQGTQIKDRLGELQLALSQLDDFQQGYLSLLQSLNWNKTQQEQALQEQLKAQEFYEVFKAGFHWKNYALEAPEQVEADWMRAEQMQSQIKDLETKMQHMQQQEEVLRTNQTKFEKLLNSIREELAASNATIQVLQKQVLNIDLQEALNLSAQAIQHHIHQIQQAIVELKANYEKVQQLKQELDTQKAQIHIRIDLNAKHLAEAEAQLDILKKRLYHKVEQSDFKDLEEVKALLEEDFDLDAAEGRLKDFDKQLNEYQQEFNRLSVLVNGQQFNVEHFNLLQEKFEQCKLQHQSLYDARLKMSHQLKKMEQDWAQKQDMLLQQTALLKRAEHLKLMRNLFKGSGFVSYISTVYLQQLCALANQRFLQLTRQQLSLELSDKNEFMVRDYLHDGQIRSVKTLSGGQTFQASLSLALALAESLQQQSKAQQNFFFLDEGFGSQDKEALEMIFDTLKALRNENRFVGIISHVEELQQEIEVFLKVVNHTDKGSQVSASWEL